MKMDLKMEREDFLEIGRRFWFSTTADMKNFHGILLEQDLSDDRLVEIGKSVVIDQNRMKQQQKEYERQCQEQWDQMDDTERAYAKASQEMSARYGLFS